ncbi:hypothetical protein CDL15_Pgr024909 [Punica granatum]|uniref:Uncharacterized protein n=1 Tax=Punica granatum TaxID=22663 RepID=A0A218W9G6_PUNGR|nr:hypothetical protein CDL15_Pgr024909 [Punica granatum]
MEKSYKSRWRFKVDNDKCFQGHTTSSNPNEPTNEDADMDCLVRPQGKEAAKRENEAKSKAEKVVASIL